MDGVVARPVVPSLVDQVELLPSRVVDGSPFDVHELRVAELQVVRHNGVVVVPLALREVPVSVVPDSEELGVLRRDDDAVVESARLAVVLDTHRRVVDAQRIERPEDIRRNNNNNNSVALYSAF